MYNCCNLITPFYYSKRIGLNDLETAKFPLPTDALIEEILTINKGFVS